MPAFIWLVGFVALLWAVALADALTGFDASQYGVIPRTREGLKGIALHAFVHGGFGHTLSNSGPLLVLGGITSLRGRATLFGVSAFIVLCGGALVWLFGRSASHIGASGLVFGYFGYLVARGLYERKFASLLIAFLIMMFYGVTIFFGVLPSGGFVSWEGHLFGLIAGVFAAYLASKIND